MTHKKSNTPALLKIIRWIYPKLESIFPWLAHRFFIAIFFTPISYRVPEKERMVEKLAEKFFVEAGGKKIQCYSWGAGPLVLVIHGWAGRATQFRKIIQALTRVHYRIVGFDGPAHGHSEGRSTNVFEFEEALRKIYEKTGVPEAIIAHSFGGTAAMLAARNGLPMTKLINIASPTIGDEIINTYLKAIHGSARTADFFKAYVLRTTGKSFDEFTAMRFVEGIPPSLQLLLIHDENDPEVSIRHALALLKRYPAAVVFRTQGLGHTRILKDDAVIKKCISFIRD